MKLYIIGVLFAFIALTFAAPPSEVKLVKERNRHNVAGANYHFHYRLDDGRYVKETITLEDAGGEAPSITTTGQFTYFVDGVEYTVRYTADATGFHPEGDHLPRAPDAPEADLKVRPRILGAISKAV